MAPEIDEFLEAVGFWRSIGSRVVFPHPRELVDKTWDSGERERVADYLSSGVELAAYFGFSYCRFRDGPPVEEMGTADLTDGVWVWPEALGLYVRRYAVRLPEVFLAHIAANDFRVPANLNVRAMEYWPYSFSVWVHWCRKHRRNRFLALLSRLYF